MDLETATESFTEAAAVLRGKRVLVTGATGFTGGALAEALAGLGAEVRVLVRRPQALAARLQGQVEVARGDLRDREAVAQAVQECDVVYHLAALSRDASAKAHAYWDVNVGGTEVMLSACAAARISRLVYCSTMGVHGSARQIPSNETSPFLPGDEYQRSKLVAEQRVWTWHHATGIPTSVVRPAGIYGPGDRRFLTLFRMIQRGRFMMLGDGQTRFHAVFIDDLIDGLLRCGAQEAAIGEPFCICGDRETTLNEFVALIAEIVGGPTPRRHLPVWPFRAAGAVCEALCAPFSITPPVSRRRLDFFTRHRAFTSEKARRLLGYTPRVTLQQGLRRTAAWYREQGWLAPEGRA